MYIAATVVNLLMKMRHFVLTVASHKEKLDKVSLV